MHAQLTELDKHINGCKAMAPIMDRDDIDIVDIKKQLKNALICCSTLAAGQSTILQALLVYMCSGRHTADLDKAALKLGADGQTILKQAFERKLKGEG